MEMVGFEIEMIEIQELAAAVKSYKDISKCVHDHIPEEILQGMAILCDKSPMEMASVSMNLASEGQREVSYAEVMCDLKKNIFYYDWLYERLYGEASRLIYYKMLVYRFMPRIAFVRSACDKVSEKYYDKDIIGEMCANAIVVQEPISLDEQISHKISFLIIEDHAVSVIIGARNHIARDELMLAIDVSRNLTDLWEVPKLLDAVLPEYHFYIRQYSEDRNVDTVLYAVPPRKKKYPAKIRTAVTVVPHERPWTNVELIKDSGLIPYLLHKNYGIEVIMVGTTENMEDYPYAQYVKGLKFLSLPDNKDETKVGYILQYAQDIDLLILRGAHDLCTYLAAAYKEKNPMGLIYCGLDANSWWMDRLAWYKDVFRNFLDISDILATSCTAMADMLTKKWRRKIYCITNGKYNIFQDIQKKRTFAEKKNIILTVSRLGSEQKGTNILLRAYEKIADELPEWTLRLVGTVEERFQSYIDSYFENAPHLKGRVIFVGPIDDRDRLIQEYESAKIFALPSMWEGGAPNVIPEALAAGCVTAVTKFDAWEDCIDKGSCGAAADIADVDAFAEIMKNLCLDPQLEKMSARARIYADEFYNMEKNVDLLYQLLLEKRECH